MSQHFLNPYVVGARFHLEITPPSSTASDIETVHVTVVEAFMPVTVSVVLKVKLDSSIHSMPDFMIVKLYDRRFSKDVRAFHDAPPLSPEGEYEYRSLGFNKSVTRSLADWEAKRFDEDERDEEHPPMEAEAYLAALLSSYRDCEVQVYNRLVSLQGNAIPKLYGSVRFLTSGVAPEAHTNIDDKVPGILLEYIPGQSLANISTPKVSDEICLRCLDIVNTCGDAGVLNRDVRLENFIVTSAGLNADGVLQNGESRPVVMIDFAQCRLRREDENEEQWKRGKWSEDEEGAVGYFLKKKFGWDYKPSLKYMVVAEER